MSKKFVDNNLMNLFDSVTESTVQLPQYISIIDHANNTSLSATSSDMMSQMNGNFSATSSNMKGGNYSATSSMVGMKGGSYSANSSEQDVNKLISMLTSESSDNEFKNSYLGDDSDISIYATNYNVLRIMSGMGGLAYSN